MSGACKECRHYRRVEGHRLGSCVRWHEGYGVPPSQIADNEVLVENDAGWGAEMGPDFGCVLHEPATS